MNNVEKYLDDLVIRYPNLNQIKDKILKLYQNLESLFLLNKTLFICGNGGSCSDAEHFVGEMGKGFLSKRPIPVDLAKELDITYPQDNFSTKLQDGFRVISLNGHLSLATAYINDVDPFMVYAQQLYVLGQKGDAVIGISTSGNAKNILNMFKVAKILGISTYLLTGNNKEGICRQYADLIINAPTKETYKIQEYHLPIYHTLAMMLEERFFKDK